MLLFSNKSHVHLVVYSSSQIHDSNEYVVVLQQKFGENYFALMKKVIFFINIKKLNLFNLEKNNFI